MSQILSFAQCNATSDHVWRSIAVTYKDIKLKGCTWNLQERGYSKAENSGYYANNPFNRSEDRETYLERKNQQLKELEVLLSDADFFFLQEADFLFPETPKSVDVPWLKDVLNEVKKSFDKILERFGMSLQTLEQKEIAIVTSKKLVFIDDSLENGFPYKSWKGTETNFAMFACDFALGNESLIRLGCFHAQYGVDYTTMISEFRKKAEEETDLFIIGGDANHPADCGFPGLLVISKDQATNFYTNYNDVDPYTIVELHDTRFKVAKSYDGFVITSKDDVKYQLGGEFYWNKVVENGIERLILSPIL